MLEDDGCLLELEEISHFLEGANSQQCNFILSEHDAIFATSTGKKQEASPVVRRLMIYMFLLPHVLNNTFRTPVLFIFCCLSRKCFAQVHRQCVTTPQVDPLTNMTCIHTMLRSWRSFGTPYPTKIAANKQAIFKTCGYHC